MKRFLIIGIFYSQFVYSFSEPSFFHEPPMDAEVGEDLHLDIVTFSDNEITVAKGYYRIKGSISFQETDLKFIGASWRMTIQGSSLSGEGLEYCFVFHLTNGSILAAPKNDPFDQPYSIQVKPSKTSEYLVQIEEPVFNQPIESDILVLSPEIGSEVGSDEAIIAVSLFNVPNVDESSIRLILDGKDVTNSSEIGFGLVAYTPEEIDEGPHTVLLKLSTLDGETIKPFSWVFNVKKSSMLPTQFKYDGNVVSRFSMDYVGEDLLTVSELNGKGRFEVDYADLRMNFRQTSRDNEYMQPLNRFGANLNFMKYLDLKIGDFYSYVSPYTLDGRRVRGIGIDLNMRFFRAQVIRGKLNHAVQHSNKVDGGYRLLGNETRIDTLSQPIFTLDRRGYAFDRELSLTRISFQIFNNQFGFHFMKATDDIYSTNQFIGNEEFYVDSADVTYIDSLYSIPIGKYTYNSFLSSVENVNGTLKFPEKNWGGNKPQDNLVVGFDFGRKMDKERMRFEFSWNMSLYNRDIWDGVMTRTQLDTALDDTLDGKIGTTYDEDGNITEGSLNYDTLDVYDPTEFEDLFIMNINMLPLLPVDPTTFKSNPFSTIANMPSSAFHLRLLGNYRLSKFTVQYRQIGPEFVSLANPYLDQNIREFTISDRISLVKNKLLFNISYKYKDDKILSSVEEPLKTTNFSFGITFMPGSNSPSYVVNFQNIGKDNSKENLERVGSELMDLREESKTQNSFLSVTYPFTYGSTKHNLNLNMNTLTNEDQLAQERRKDYFFQKSDSKTISIALSSKFDSPFRSIVNVSRTSVQVPYKNDDNSIDSNELIWTSLNSNGSYTFFKDRLRVSAGLSYLSNKGTTPISLYGIKGGAEGKIMNGMKAVLSGHIQMRSTEEETTLNTSGLLFSFRYNF